MSKPKHLLSPLRYPGSKRRLVGYIEDALKLNSLRPNVYAEPFVGGASVALHLLQCNQVERVVLMDVDPWITSFWETVFFDSEWLIQQIYEIDITLDKWKYFKSLTPKSRRDMALTCFFLNRTSFSGILEPHVGPLGGRNQDSIYKIDCRFPRETLAGRIQAIAVYRDFVAGIWNCSWKDGIAEIEKQRESRNFSNIFYYLDPPFFEKADTLYRHYFTEDDHIQLRDTLLTLPEKWILSYDSAQQVELLYGDAIQANTNGTQKHDIELFYSLSVMQERVKGKEVILSNLEKLPDLDKLPGKK